MADIEEVNQETPEDEVSPERVPGVTGVLIMTAGDVMMPRKHKTIRLTGTVVSVSTI